jgi:hypothetical protein
MSPLRCLHLVVSIAFAIALIACSRQESADVQQTSKLEVDVYRTFDGTSFIPCSRTGDAGRCGERFYRRPLDPESEYETGMPGDEDFWYDCSDAEFSCVSNPLYLMAVPKSGLTQGLVYLTRGFELTVVLCSSESPRWQDQDRCDTALISARCTESCTCLTEKAPRAGVLFYYSKSIGISAFMLTPSIEQMSSADPSRSWSLITDKGFLVDDFKLQPAGASRPCSKTI